jgi:cholesterol 7-dehydrogenase
MTGVTETGGTHLAWVPIARSTDLAEGSVVSCELVSAEEELDLAVWRGHDGIVCVTDARCPHQWSHLAAEGVVDGDEIVCAAHFWRFDRGGHGTKVNVKGRRDAKSDVAVHPSREVEGHIEILVPAHFRRAPGPVG